MLLPPPKIAVFSLLGGLLPSISVAALLKYLVLFIFNQITTNLSHRSIGGNLTLLFPLELFVLDSEIPNDCVFSVLDCLTKHNYNVTQPVKILAQNFIQHDAGLN